MQGTAALCMILMILISAYLGYGLFYPKVEEVLGPVRYAVYHSSFKELYEQLRGGYKSGGINGGKLGRGGKLKFNYRAHLVVYSEQDVNQYTYLKGYAGDVYTGDEWVALDSDLYQALYEEADADQEDLMSLPYSVVNALKNETLYGYALSQFTTMRIYIRLPDETVGDGSYVCLPYGGLISQADGTLMDLNYVARADQSNLENVYDSYYCQTTGGWTGEGLEELVSTLSDVKAFTDIEPLILENDELLEKAWSQEQVYREFVYANDLDVPDRVSRLREEYSGKTFGNLSQAIAFVQNEVAKGATYTLEPENCPYGSDFIENFMYEDKEGYCTYFASAAVMIFRCLGIPARFVQGYLVPPLTANEEVTVDDSYAHAWAEIYVDNFGWIPVEVTPGLGGLPGGFTPEMNREGGNASYTEESTTEAPTTTEEPTTEESTTEESTTEEQITTDEPEEEPTLPQLTDSDETSSEEEPTQESAGIEQEVTASDTEDLRTSKKTKPAPEGSTGEGKTGTDAGTDAEVGNQSHAIFLAVLAVIKTLGIIFAVILALTGGLYVHHRSRCAARRRRFRQKSNRNSTLAMYHELCKMSGHYHVPMDETTAPHELSLAYPVDEQTWQAVQALVREAAFSDHEITEEQKSLMLGVYNQCCRHVDSKLKFIKKMMFRIWDGYR
jgi:transglutaminase-like putative cysteine protease